MLSLFPECSRSFQNSKEGKKYLLSHRIKYDSWLMHARGGFRSWFIAHGSWLMVHCSYTHKGGFVHSSWLMAHGSWLMLARGWFYFTARCHRSVDIINLFKMVVYIFSTTTYFHHIFEVTDLVIL